MNGEVLEFGNTSALYNSDMVMYDLQTLSYWFQVEGEAIVGDLTGGGWISCRPATCAGPSGAYLPQQPRPLPRHRLCPPLRAGPLRPTACLFERRPLPLPGGRGSPRSGSAAGGRVIGLVLADEARAYPLAGLAGSVANDTVAGTPVAVVVDEA